jgi:hypothetical protein
MRRPAIIKDGLLSTPLRSAVVLARGLGIVRASQNAAGLRSNSGDEVANEPRYRHPKYFLATSSFSGSTTETRDLADGVLPNSTSHVLIRRSASCMTLKAGCSRRITPPVWVTVS